MGDHLPQERENKQISSVLTSASPPHLEPLGGSRVSLALRPSTLESVAQQGRTCVVLA